VRLKAIRYTVFLRREDEVRQLRVDESLERRLVQNVSGWLILLIAKSAVMVGENLDLETITSSEILLSHQHDVSLGVHQLLEAFR
jgi:hypothetical protein